jgi:hypothetical protein
MFSLSCDSVLYAICYAERESYISVYMFLPSGQLLWTIAATMLWGVLKGIRRNEVPEEMRKIENGQNEAVGLLE